MTTRIISVTSDLLEVCKTAVADAARAVNPSARLPNYEQMVSAIAKTELAITTVKKRE